MKKIIFITAGIFILLVTTAQSKKFILQNINVIDVLNERIVSHQAIVIVGQRIENIQPVSGFSPSANDSIIDGTDKYIIPGLWDMHVHVWSDDYFFPLFIANGVTGFRDMFGGVKSLQQWKKNISDENKLVPDFFYSGPIVDGPNPIWPGSIAVANAEDGRKAVDSLKNKLKTDFVKVYSQLSRESYFAIANECQKQHIDFAGHVPNAITALEAARAGQKSEEHLNGMIEIVSDSSDFYFNLIRNNEITDSIMKHRINRRKMLLRTFNENKLVTVANKIAAYGTWICPTLTVNYGISYMNDSTLAKDKRMKYIMPFMKNMWDPKQDFRFKNQPADYFDVNRKEFEKKLIITKALHKAGVKLLAGTDTPNPYCFPGFSIHDELQWMVKSGLSPTEALQCATINPAIYFSIQKDYGTIEKGKIASLVILNQNPLSDIRNTTDIWMVILRGRILDQQQLNNLLNKAMKFAAN